MAELVPTLQAGALRQGIVDYLTTTFALADPEAAQALTEFLSDAEDGIFRGPYLRLRLPYRPAEDGWQRSLDWDPGLVPYGHQAAAYARLTTNDLGSDKPRPLPTLVTTGTGSGKTEAFLHPILDHVVRANRAGVTGTKALILYPMNALANDQAGRLTRLLTTRPELASVTAGIYTGEQDPEHRTIVSKRGLINDRGAMRSSAPDILLTNYKMLDQLLLRQDDQPIWRQSATSLTYLVLDEFHTYDGAQGTDVAMLLRRLGIALRSHWPDADPAISEDDRVRPLGKITPVATSATLGDRGDPLTMVGFAHTVFGDDFGPDSVITESRLSLDEWVGQAVSEVTAQHRVPRRLRDLNAHELGTLVKRCDQLRDDPHALTREVFGALMEGDPEGEGSGASPFPGSDDAAAAEAFLRVSRALPDVQALAEAAVEASRREDLLEVIFPTIIAADAATQLHLMALDYLVAALSHVRAIAGREAITVELNLWVRELTRIDRDASLVTAYRWSDDGERVGGTVDDAYAPTFPALYCRHCGRSGWGVELAAVGNDLQNDDAAIRKRHAMKEGRFRPLLAAPAEADFSIGLGRSGGGERIENLLWFDTDHRTLLSKMPEPDDERLRAGRILPVLTHVGIEADDLSRKDTCPSCLQEDGIRFLGSAIATLLSVTLSTLFGDAALDPREKKSLVFTDSVQDAAHRAGFVEARSHTLTFRAMLRDAIGAGPCTLDELVERVFHRAGSDPFSHYRMVPPDCIDRDEFDGWWKPNASVGRKSQARARVKRRLLFDTTLEFGLQSSFGRTLERTGSVAVQVEAGSPERLASLARTALDLEGVQDTLDAPLAATPEADLVAWVRGVLEHMRQKGGIAHEWLAKYIASDGRRFFIWGGRPRTQGMPAFPSGRAAPAYPRVGGATMREPLLDSVTSPQSWYANWTAKTLRVSPKHGAVLAKALLERLAKEDVLTASVTESGGTVYALAPSSIVIAPITDDELAKGSTLLVCDVCRTHLDGTSTVVTQLDGRRCTSVRCPGRLVRTGRSMNFYRDLYASSDMRRIVSREHSSLLEDDVRLEYERAFRSGGTDPGAPNVLVATPTLEMGIDIGDLSTVLLASLPRTVASYLQRVGRAGRLTGNSLNVAFVTGRGEHLPRLGDPLSVINGEVRPPATYLNADEILQRQYIASVIDRMARNPSQFIPGKAGLAMESAGTGTFLGDLVTEAEEHADEYLAEFLATFDSLKPDTQKMLRAWARPQEAATEIDRGSSGLASLVYGASQRWVQLDLDLAHRRQEILAKLPELKAAAESPAASDDDKRDFRSAESALKLVGRHHNEHRNKHWISSLEEYGLLPNYTLVDDSVTLDVSVTWRDPETNAYMSEQRTFNRVSSLALRDFAPGATFYARGLEMDIDGLDLGTQTNLIRPWAWCDVCGYACDLAPAGNEITVTSCPRCGSSQIADAAQRFEVVELTRVLSEVRRDESRINDSSDERKKTRFVIAVAPDLNPANVTRQWAVAGGTFGIAHYRSMDIRWLNAGRASVSGMSARSVAGQQLPNTMFRVCAACGKADSHANHNNRHEHRPWCRYRDATSEDARVVGLTRTLTTQAVVLSLPLQVTLGDSFAVPSLAAAVLLGLRERMGGNPDHLEVATIPAPIPGGAQGEVRDALLLHDIVPGGTGYLADLAEPEEMWDLLATALRVVAECPCKEENRMACHRCLLPFSFGLGADRLSRLAAERHLRTILGMSSSVESDEIPHPDAMGWQVTEGPVGSGSNESHLELLFRKIFQERLQALNATVKEKPGPSGNRLTITFGGDQRVWTLTPQELAYRSMPDFVLRSNDPGIPPIAIFTDGWTFHASPQHNRVADDATKRNTLRLNDFAVLALTEANLTDSGVNAPAYDWVLPPVVDHLLARPAGQPGGGFNRDAVTALTGGPMDWLMSWIQQPHHTPRKALADAVWMLLAADGAAGVAVADGSSLVGRAVELMTTAGNEPASDAPSAIWWRDGQVGVLTRLHPTTQTATETVVILDDRDSAVTDPDHKQAWQRWLQLANAFTDASHTVLLASTTQATTAGPPAATVPTVAAPALDLAPEWTALADLVKGSPLELALVRALAASTAVPVPLYGEEFGNGTPVDFAWPDRMIAVLVDPDEASVDDLQANGWTVVDAEIDALMDALTDKEAY